MKITKTKILNDEIEYPLVFDLNVAEEIQEEYGTLDEWGRLTDGDEPNVKAVVFGFEKMLNEGIDIENEEKGENRPFITHKQAARLATAIGLKELTEAMNKTVLDSSNMPSKNA